MMSDIFSPSFKKRQLFITNGFVDLSGEEGGVNLNIIHVVKMIRLYIDFYQFLL